MIYASKLMMQTANTLNYVKDDSLLFKRENEAWGAAGGLAINTTIENIRSGGDIGFTYCGTLPLVAGWLIRVINNRMYLYRHENGKIFWRNYSSGSAISSPIQGSTDVQSYVAATLYFPTETTQTVTMSVDGSETVTATGNWAGTIANNAEVRLENAGSDTVMDLVLIYNRVLTDAELEQNYQAFLARHR